VFLLVFPIANLCLVFPIQAVIDYLKIDIEGSEYASLATAMKDGSLARAKQLGIEFHLHSLSRRGRL
jgi:hypothetical protein